MNCIAHQTPLSVGFSRKEYWNGLPCPSPGDLPDPGIEPTSLPSAALAVEATHTHTHTHTASPGKPCFSRLSNK